MACFSIKHLLGILFSSNKKGCSFSQYSYHHHLGKESEDDCSVVFIPEATDMSGQEKRWFGTLLLFDLFPNSLVTFKNARIDYCFFTSTLECNALYYSCTAAAFSLYYNQNTASLPSLARFQALAERTTVATNFPWCTLLL